jgi:hypothetical protein
MLEVLDTRSRHTKTFSSMVQILKRTRLVAKSQHTASIPVASIFGTFNQRIHFWLTDTRNWDSQHTQLLMLIPNHQSRIGGQLATRLEKSRLVVSVECSEPQVRMFDTKVCPDLIKVNLARTESQEHVSMGNRTDSLAMKGTGSPALLLE